MSAAPRTPKPGAPTPSSPPAPLDVQGKAPRKAKAGPDAGVAAFPVPQKHVSVRRVPQQARGQQTVQTVLRAAGEEIERAGLDHLSTKRIAAAAGLSVGSLYGYFPNKESIIAALLEAWLARVYEAIDAVHPRHGGVRDIFSYLGEQMERAMAVYDDQPGLGALFSMTMAMPALDGIVRQHGERVVESLATALAHYAPKADGADVRSVAHAIPLMCHQLLASAMIDRQVDRPRLVVNIHVCLTALATRLLLPPSP